MRRESYAQDVKDGKDGKDGICFLMMRTVTYAVRGLVPAVFLGGATLAAQHRNDSHVLSADEIARSSVRTAYEAVELLRPRWLRRAQELNRIPSASVPSRAGTGLPREFTGERSAPSNQDSQKAGAAVYLNGHAVGDLDYLKSIPSGIVQEMRWRDPFEAANEFGPTDGQAAIVVTLRQGP